MKHPPDSSEQHNPATTDAAAFPSEYEFRVAGRISGHGASWFEDMTLAVDESTKPPQTIIRSHIVDQAALFGLISRIRDLGLTLLSVTRTEQGEADDKSLDSAG